MNKISYIEGSTDEWLRSFVFSHPVKVRFSETDMFGHMNNTSTITYFEEARIEFFKSLGLMQEWLGQEDDRMPVVANIQCDYLSQVFFDQTLRLHVKVNRVGGSSLDLHYAAVSDAQELLFTGRGTIVQVSKTSGKPVQWTEADKNLLLTGASV
ncbi:acyl-CoA thioesterase [Bacillus lacus]|uniref:Acyl-CoA thioesterase n=1 Tax=Metabacillus lacus TaxID=1983721 RepID=A0A7X2LZC8_9BACI|nr:thioesterase family protein [Metabacillus lacus]MRX71812.1 acyl-CoA thioesterase [Metabacillus lacus]